MNLHHNVNSAADALRQLADRLEATPVADFGCPVTMSVDIQAVLHTGEPANVRRGVIDLLATHLDLGMPVDLNVYVSRRDSRGVEVAAFTRATDEDNPYVG